MSLIRTGAWLGGRAVTSTRGTLRGFGPYTSATRDVVPSLRRSLAASRRADSLRMARSIAVIAGDPRRRARQSGGQLCSRNLSTGVSLPDHVLLDFPKLSPTMTSGGVASWKKSVGDPITAGDVLAEIETDKATMDVVAQEDGFLARILVEEGATDIQVGAPFAVIVDESSDVASFANYIPGTEAESVAAKETVSNEPPTAPHQDSPDDYPAHEVLTMPKLSPTPDATTAHLASWCKAEGDEIAEGDVLASIETDKAAIDFAAQESGYLAKILIPAGGDPVDIGAPIAIVTDEKDDVSAFASYSARGGSASSVTSKTEQSGSEPQSIVTPPQASGPSSSVPPKNSSGRVLASPLARRRAAEAGVDLSTVTGTGPDGRVVIMDIEQAVKTGKVASSVTQQPSADHNQSVLSSAAVEGAYTDSTPSKFKQVTAQRLLESKQTIPHYYLTIECTVDKMLELRKEMNDRAKNGEYKLSVNDFVIKAAACALMKVPAVNSQWMGSVVREFHDADISVAVMTDKGLITPIVAGADRKGLKSISSTVRELAQKAKENKLKPEEFIGGTFTISNLGMYGIDEFSAVINPPQAAILAVAGTRKAIVPNESGEAAVASVMKVTLSCDHRVVDGAVGATWLQAFKEHLEEPISMLL